MPFGVWAAVGSETIFYVGLRRSLSLSFARPFINIAGSSVFGGRALIASQLGERIHADDHSRSRRKHRELTAWRRAIFKSALGLLCCVLATATSLAAETGDWANCQSEDQDLNIPACTRILDDVRLTGADRLKALNLRARAYLARHSFVSASRDFGEIIAAQPGNIAALTGRAIADYRNDDREKAVIDYSVALRLAAEEVEVATKASDELKEIARYMASAPAPDSRIQSIVDGVIAARAACPNPGACPPASNSASGPRATSEEATTPAENTCNRLAASPLDTTRPPGVPGVAYNDLDAGAAVPACRDAQRDRPNDPRLAFQLARVLDKSGNVTEAMTFYKQAAEAGSAVAMNNLGQIYQRSTGGTKDYAASRAWLEKSAQAGFPLAMISLGMMHANGWGGAKDLAEARRWFEKGAASGNAVGFTQIANLYLNGSGVAKDYALARAYYEKGMVAGDAGGAFGLALLYQNGWGVPKDYEQARNLYRKAADAGDVGGMRGMGIIYHFGLGVPKDFVQAAQWYQKAAQGGELVAMNNLAALYLNGWGVPQRYDEARRLYQQAADNGQANAMTGLGIIYRDGRGVPKDYAQARQWFEKAAEAGDGLGMADLAALYQTGSGVPTRYEEALRWYQKAANAGDANGMTGVGILYQNGWGVPKDYTEARRWFEKAAEAGEMGAMTNLGVLYQNGQGVPQSYVAARQWYQKAAAAGEPAGMASLGAFYFNGWGGAKDRAQAIYWTEQAAAAGNQLAKKNLRVIRR
jgi:TPR repeat protein